MILPALALAVLLRGSTGEDSIRVHEWGVVLYSADSVTAAGSPGYDPFGAVCVDAPVVYFHGAAFTGDVTVCSIGDIFSVYPEPDATGGILLGDLGGLGSAVRWEDLSADPGNSVDRISRMATDGLLIPGFGWAMDYWRVPEASWLTRRSDSFRDRFLYYEVELTRVGFPLPLEAYAPTGTPEAEISHEVLVFSRGENGVVALVHGAVSDVLTADESMPVDLPWQSVPEAFETIRGWAGGLLTGEEIQALWATWEPYLLYGDWQGDSLLIFPVPQPLIERISTLMVAPDQDIPVTISRFFLGMKATG
jgi:hypothetical protein